MPSSLERSELRVEGIDDLHAIINLLRRHGIDYDPKPWPDAYPNFEEAKSVEKLLEGMELAIRIGGGRVIGFVLDADSPLIDRWQAVRDRLIRVDVQPVPMGPSADGFIGESPTFKTRVGVWLMPDNQHDGSLETFLRDLVQAADPLIGHAETSTDTASQLGARFPAIYRIKAVLHAWLAWQEVPGNPYGTAIRAHYFRHDSPTALKFVEWFRSLYRIDIS